MCEKFCFLHFSILDTDNKHLQSFPVWTIYKVQFKKKRIWVQIYL